MDKCQCGQESYGHLDLCAPCAIVALLVEEHGMDIGEASQLVATHVNVVSNGIMSGNLRAAAIALQMHVAL